MSGGETEIRTLEGVATLPVFKTGAFNRSAISPFFASFVILLIKLKSKYKGYKNIRIKKNLLF